jgi:hypothetical protein
MKRLLVALFLALVASLALAVNAASATHSNGQGPNQDLAAGTGQVAAVGLDFKVHVDAKSGPMGEDPQGHFRLEAVQPFFGVDVDIRGQVTCLQVIDNRATIGGVIERSNDPRFPEGSGILIFVRDDDEGAGDGVSMALLPSPPQTCEGFADPFRPNTQGNFIVHDAL